MKSGTLRMNMPLGKFILPQAKFVDTYVLRILLEKKGKSGRSRRSCRKAVLSSEEFRIAGIVRIRGDTQESELFRETVTRHLLSSDFPAFSPPIQITSTSRELDFISPVGVAKEDPFLRSRALVKGEESDGIHLRQSGIHFAANTHQIFSRTVFALAKRTTG